MESPALRKKAGDFLPPESSVDKKKQKFCKKIKKMKNSVDIHGTNMV